MDRSKLESQLAAALKDGDAVEIGSIAGLLARTGEPPPEVMRWRAHGGAAAFAAELDEATLDALVHAAAAVDFDTAPEEIADLLLAVDELCAGDAWCGAGRLAETVDLLVRAVHAWPGPWARASELASAVLATPMSGDPARVMWAAVEAAAMDVAVEPDEGVFLTRRIRTALGLPVRISLTAEIPARLAAADVPPPPPWHVLGRGEGWEVALTEEGGNRVLVVATVVVLNVAFVFAGEERTPAVREGAFVVVAQVGAWQVRVGTQVLSFDLEP